MINKANYSPTFPKFFLPFPLLIKIKDPNDAICSETGLNGLSILKFNRHNWLATMCCVRTRHSEIFNRAKSCWQYEEFIAFFLSSFYIHSLLELLQHCFLHAFLRHSHWLPLTANKWHCRLHSDSNQLGLHPTNDSVLPVLILLSHSSTIFLSLCA